MFESLKKKLSSTVGKITDKLSKEEEEAKKSEDQDKSEAAQKAGKTDTKKAPKSEVKQEEKSEKRKEKSDTKEPEQEDSLMKRRNPQKRRKKVSYPSSDIKPSQKRTWMIFYSNWRCPFWKGMWLWKWQKK